MDLLPKDRLDIVVDDPDVDHVDDVIDVIVRVAGGVGIVIEQVPGALRVTITAPDRPGLLAAAAAVLTLHRLTVRTAGLRTIEGTALQTWDGRPAVR